MLRHRGGEDFAVFVADERLGAAGADVDAEQVGHEACSSDGPVSIFAPGEMSATSIETPRGRIVIRADHGRLSDALRDLRFEALTTSPDVVRVVGPTRSTVTTGRRSPRATTNDAVFSRRARGRTRRPDRDPPRHQRKEHTTPTSGACSSNRRGAELGVAQTLVNAACDWARTDAGVAIVKLTVVPRAAQGVLPALRVPVTGVDPAALRWNGRYYDELLMHRWVQPNEPAPCLTRRGFP